MSSIIGLMSFSWLLLSTRVSSRDILLRPPGRVSIWFLCSQSVWTFCILQHKYINRLSGCQGKRSKVCQLTCECLQAAPPADCLPDPATPGPAAPVGPVEPSQTGSLTGPGAEASSSSSAGHKEVRTRNSGVIPPWLNSTCFLPGLAAGPGPGSRPVPAAQDFHNRSTPLEHNGACCSSAGALGV